MQQYLFHNNGDGTFKECALESGAGLNLRWQGPFGMGIVFQDYDNDGRPDCGRYPSCRASSTLFYHNDGDGSFSYRSLESGMGALTSAVRLGVGLEDFRQTPVGKIFFVAQSHVLDNVQQIDATLRYKELPLLALNRNGRFERADSGVTTPLAARGCRFRDINKDWLDGRAHYYSRRTSGPAA